MPRVRRQQTAQCSLSRHHTCFIAPLPQHSAVPAALRPTRKKHRPFLYRQLQRIAARPFKAQEIWTITYMFANPLQVRYNAVRRQTAAKAGEKEFQVLDYQNTSADLLPLVASSYALIFMVRRPSAVAQHA